MILRAMGRRHQRQRPRYTASAAHSCADMLDGMPHARLQRCMYS